MKKRTILFFVVLYDAKKTGALTGQAHWDLIGILRVLSGAKKPSKAIYSHLHLSYGRYGVYFQINPIPHSLWH